MFCAKCGNDLGDSGSKFCPDCGSAAVGEKVSPNDQAITRKTSPPPMSPLRVGNARVPCPYCAEQIMPAASLCPHCRSDVTPVVLPPPVDGTPEGWLLDPSGRFPDRWWGGAQTGWTIWVRDKPGGTRSEDPPYLRSDVTPVVLPPPVDGTPDPANVSYRSLESSTKNGTGIMNATNIRRKSM